MPDDDRAKLVELCAQYGVTIVADGGCNPM